jgi:hypothetical protein
MNYDIEEAFRLDPGETEMSDELQAEVAMEQQLAEQNQVEAQQVETEAAPTGVQQPPQQSAPSTEGEEKDQQFPWEEGYDLGDYARNTLESAYAPATGLLDFGVDVINKLTGQEFAKPTKFENEVAQSVRELSAVVFPTIGLTRLGMGGGAAAQSRVGWSLGNTAFMKFVGSRGVEAAAGVAVGAVSSEYESDNITGRLKRKWPKAFDWIPDSFATLDGDDTDTKRLKNIYEDLGMGTVIDFTQGAMKFVKALANVAGSLRKSNRLVGETTEARKWLEGNSPKARPDDPEEAVIDSALRREDALDEVGYYNLSENPNLDQRIKGVHDMFDYTELGVRSVDDFGVVGAAIDSARIAKNLDTTYGRLGNMLSEPALKYALKNGENGQDIVLGLADQLHKAGRIGMEGASGWKVSFDDVIDANENLAIQLFDPRMSKTEVRMVLEPYITRDASGKEILAEEGFATAAKALRGFGSDLTSMDVARAQSLLAGSLSGRISDLAEGARMMEGTAAVKEAQEKIIDLMQYVTQLSGSAKYYKNRKMNLVQMIANGFKNIEGYNAASVEQAGEVAQQVFQDSQRFASTMRQIAENQPEIMDQFLLAYELTDGSIDTITKMNRYIHGMTTDLGKGLINLTPEVENKLIAGVWSNIFNNVLSAFVTPIQALVGNFGGIVSQPVSHFAGAVMAGDLQAIQRGWIAYSSVVETMNKAMPYAGNMFVKASKDPNSVRGGTRIDLLMQSEKELEFLRKAADTQAAAGNDGLTYVVNQIEMLNDLGKDPVFRFGPNAMTALDGFTGVFNASAEARFRAMDELVAAGKPITKENVKPIADKYYKQMFDESGMLQDDAVKYATSEIALNLDSPLASNVSSLVQYVPGLRPFLMFPTTGMNMIDIAGKYNPVLTPFQRDVNELAYVKLEDLMAQPGRVDELLKARNIDVDGMDVTAKLNRIADLKYTTRGRKAMGVMATTGAIGLYSQGRLRGDGLYDKEAQRAREKNTNWKSRTYMGLDGKWHSYAWLGPLADWVAFVANVGDNFDMLGSAYTEKFFEKAAFILGASVTDRTGLSTMKPLMDMLSGNEGAMTRWGAGFVNSLGPLAGQRAEWGRIFSEGLREVDNDFFSVLANRNKFLPTANPDNRAPYVYSPVTGKKANGYGFLQRVWNAYSPLQVHSGQSPEEKFLEEFEFDVNTTFRTKNGVKLTANERSALFKLMGEQGNFRRSINEIMGDAGDWQSIARLRRMRRLGVPSDEADLRKWDQIHIRLSQARRDAEEFAYAEMDQDMYAEIERRQIEQQLIQEANVAGETLDPTIQELYRK